MYHITEFCRVCLQDEKPLVDITKKEVESETLLNKLKLCVSELEWISESILMCQQCIQRLNSAFDFKRQCLQSAQLLASYVSQLTGCTESEASKLGGKVYVSVNRNEVKRELVDQYVKIQKEEEESQKPTTFIVKPGQQLFPQLLLTTNTSTSTNLQGGFPNIFLNLVPTTAVKYPTATNVTFMPNQVNNTNVKATPTIKDANQNMFLSINNAFHKILPVLTPSKETVSSITKVVEDVNISRILTQSITEELSVDVDPMCFDYSPEDDSSSSQDESNDLSKDWEDLISSSKIVPTVNNKIEVIKNDANVKIPVLKNPPSNNSSFNKPSTPQFIPISPKTNTDLPTDVNEKIITFFNVDHFMASKENDTFMNDSLPNSLMCEQCGQVCDTLKSLRHHIKQFHLGKFPYKCNLCSSVYALRSLYESHLQRHAVSISDSFDKDTITLEDLSLQSESQLLSQQLMTETGTYGSLEISDKSEDDYGQFEHKCEQCPRTFNSLHGLSRHKMRKHKQKTRRKYFIKGMKNAKCDICNREFSTQSYLQLHIKLHYRKNDYRLKVFNKDKYQQEQKKKGANKAEGIDDDIDVIDLNKEEKNQVQDEEVETDLTDEMEKTSEGIKIKINLKSIKQSPAEEENINEVICETTVIEEEEKLVNGDLDKQAIIEERTSSDSVSETSHDMNMDCEENGVLSPNTELSEELESFKDEGSLEERRPPIKIVMVDGKPQCSYCYKLFSRKHDLKRHVNNIHLKAIQYVCHLCNSQFYEAFHLTRHLRQHNGFVRCTLCMKDFSVMRDLKLHLFAVHENDAPSQCGSCGQIFQKIKYLREHMHQHDKTITYKCHICSEEFKESRELSKHLVKHSGMYSCSTCQTTFTAEYELSNHFKCHSTDSTSEERKYECELCHNKYKKKRYLSAHMSSRHATTNKVELDYDSS